MFAEITTPNLSHNPPSNYYPIEDLPRNFALIEAIQRNQELPEALSTDAESVVDIEFQQQQLKRQTSLHNERINFEITQAGKRTNEIDTRAHR